MKMNKETYVRLRSLAQKFELPSFMCIFFNNCIIKIYDYNY